MKRVLFVFAIFFMMGGSKAQSVAEARKLLYYDRYDGAASQLRAALKADPGNSEAWWLLEQVYVHQKRVPALRDTLGQMPAAVAQQPMGLCAYGQLLLEEHKKDSAMGYFNRAMEMTKQKDVPVMLAITRAEDAADSADANYAYAVDVLNKAIKREKRNADLYVAQGNIYRHMMDGTNAYKAYQDALAQDSHNVEALYRMGKIFVSQNNAEMYLKYFTDATTADPLYAPAWYELYYYNYFRDVNKAKECLDHYIAASDPSPKNDYLVTDLLYSSRKYAEAIDHARQLIARQGKVSEPRLYKLVAYSYKELHDSTKALDYMKQYFQLQTDTGFVVKDYSTMGEIYASLGQADSAAVYFVKADGLEKDSIQRQDDARKLADLYKKQKDYSNEAQWLGKYYTGNTKATNLDLFNWGLAHYMAKEYPAADTVFGIYETKYPEQEFGYYWRARCGAAIDTAMSKGLAIPDYMKLIEVDAKDSTNKTFRKHLIEAYGYIAAYKANTEKDYAGSIDYFERLLSLDPNNTDAQRYVAILKKNLSRMAGKGSSGESAAAKSEKGEKADK
ncbi:tetratricopeptide repeat protein [Puia dinghuensis]|nr:tetratricopeptide repeat protein [Puia dinghuensis]